MALATTPTLTLPQFRAIEPRLDYVQLVEGELVVNFPGFEHQIIQSRVQVALAIWCAADPARGVSLGTLGVAPGGPNYFGPDVTWYPRERMDPRRDDDTVLPGLCVEVRSSSTWHIDTGPKRERLESGGLPELWLVDGQSKTVRVLRRSHADAPRFDVDTVLSLADTLTSPQLPGFALSLAELFARP